MGGGGKLGDPDERATLVNWLMRGMNSEHVFLHDIKEEARFANCKMVVGEKGVDHSCRVGGGVESGFWTCSTMQRFRASTWTHPFGPGGSSTSTSWRSGQVVTGCQIWLSFRAFSNFPLSHFLFTLFFWLF